jgi:LDH2 family malate/lactate/ureidoglycolate dehydrogenase
MPTGQLTALRISADDLHGFCVAALTSVGVDAADADTTATALVTADTWGTFTHGVKLLRGYVRRLRGGGLRATGRPSVVADGPAWAIVDGDSALGAVTSVLAMRTAIAKARGCGIGYAGVRNSCHFGAAGYYASLAAAEGLIGLAMANDTPSVTAPGARGAITGSNPLAFAVPTGSGQPILLDMATSTVAGGKVAAAHALGKSIPDHWAVDGDGQPTTDPGDFLRGGALRPMAAHKGYGLALLIETLSAALTGAAVTRQVVSWVLDDPAVPTGHGAAFLAIDVSALMPPETFRHRIDRMAQEIRQAPKAAGAERIYLPGEMEWEQRERALAEGVLLPPDVVESITALADDLGISLSGDRRCVSAPGVHRSHRATA